MKCLKLMLSGVLFLSISSLLPGCGEPENISETSLSDSKTGQMLFVGQSLWQGDTFYGEIVQTTDSHTFTDGTVEAGVLVDFSKRKDMEGSPPAPLWLPARSAATMTRTG
ncbi:MAG TPA: hypothetical protein VF681_03730 [Abditibacteriaceae bacterium]|jgi:hypothetical protein